MESTTETLPDTDDSCPDCWAMPTEAHTRDCAIAHDPNAAALLNTIRGGGAFPIPTDADLIAAIQRGIEAGTMIEVDDAYLARLAASIEEG